MTASTQSDDDTRLENDGFGDIAVASDRYWGAQTQRALGNFDIGIETMPAALIRALGTVKHCAARCNGELGELDPAIAQALAAAAAEVMQGKVNPTQCEALCMVCAQVIGNHAAVTAGGMQGQLQLNTFKPLIIFNVLQSIALLSDAVSSFNRHCLSGTEPHREQLQQHLEQSLMLVTALAPHIGYETAAAIARKAHAEGLSLREAALANGALDGDTFDKLTAVDKMTRAR